MYEFPNYGYDVFISLKIVVTNGADSDEITWVFTV